MDFDLSYIKGVPVLGISRNDGSLLDEDAVVFGKKIVSLLKRDEKRIAIDLRHKTYINSFGLGELINLRNLFLEWNIVCLLIVDSAKINKLFEMVGIADLFETVKSENEL